MRPKRTTCNKPDREAPGIICGHPLPCPWHTVVIDTTAEPVPMIQVPATATPHVHRRQLNALKKIAMVIKDEIKKI